MLFNLINEYLFFPVDIHSNGYALKYIQQDLYMYTYMYTYTCLHTVNAKIYYVYKLIQKITHTHIFMVSSLNLARYRVMKSYEYMTRYNMEYK